MANIVTQSRKAQLGVQLGTDKLKINGYLCLWGAIVAGLCYWLAADPTIGWWPLYFPALLVAGVALAGNGMIYSKNEIVRMSGYGINMILHFLVALLIVPMIFVSIRLTVLMGVLWYWNPFLRVIKADHELSALLAAQEPGTRQAVRKAAASDDFDTKPGWDQAAKRRKP
ncbi:MAG TPA: hypothetical protein VL860_13305 [Planctomycetota bacterium]|nr:hypothetical protein [Planctomycetota bacterium]